MENMSKFIVSFSHNYTDVEYGWEEEIIDTPTCFDFSEGIEVDSTMTVEELFELMKSKSREDYGSDDTYTDIQITKKEE